MMISSFIKRMGWTLTPFAAGCRLASPVTFCKKLIAFLGNSVAQSALDIWLLHDSRSIGAPVTAQL